MTEQRPAAHRLTVTVIIPAYNRADLLPETLASLLDQTRVPDEIIVVDDGSTDGTPDLLANYDPPVRVIRQENRGLAGARNTGIDAAQGDLIAFLDSDDLLLPASIERRAEYLETHPAVDVVYSDVNLLQGTRILGTYTQRAPRPRPSGSVFAFFARDNLMPLHGFMLRRDCLAHNRFDASMNPAEDYDLWVRLAAQYRFHYIDEPLAVYRLHDTMMTRVYWDKMVAANVAIMERIRQMPAFAALTPAERAAAYRMHGKKYAYTGCLADARQMFRAALRARFSLVDGYLWLLTWSGRKLFSVILSIPRRLRGDLPPPG